MLKVERKHYSGTKTPLEYSKGVTVGRGAVPHGTTHPSLGWSRCLACPGAIHLGVSAQYDDYAHYAADRPFQPSAPCLFAWSGRYRRHVHLADLDLALHPPL